MSNRLSSQRGAALGPLFAVAAAADAVRIARDGSRALYFDPPHAGRDR